MSLKLCPSCHAANKEKRTACWRCEGSLAFELAAPKCSDCGETETIITRKPFPVEWLLNRMCGIGEQWECPLCGHVWPKSETPQHLKR